MDVFKTESSQLLNDAIGKAIKEAWPKPGQLTLDEDIVNNGF
ncbi:hypothetical protein [Rubripirellula amarantea]|nr:hypothetical protein [Rubripirellula amarantea]